MIKQTLVGNWGKNINIQRKVPACTMYSCPSYACPGFYISILLPGELRVLYKCSTYVYMFEKVYRGPRWPSGLASFAVTSVWGSTPIIGSTDHLP